MGPEYPGEGAMNNILIAGSTDIQEENKNFPFLLEEVEELLKIT